MALNISFASPCFACPSFSQVPSPISYAFRPSQCLPISAKMRKHEVPRRTANFKRTIWDYDFVQSLTSGYQREAYAVHTEKLKQDVKHLIEVTDDSLSQLELIDNIQRLGLRYLFDKEIKDVLGTIALKNSKRTTETEEDLSAAALRFRLLRQHGYNISSDVFGDFKDTVGGFKASLSVDIKGMLNLYEASHLAFPGETILDEARDFAVMHLKKIKEKADPILNKKVERALELPLHWRMERAEARWYMDIYEIEEGMNSTLLQLAKLDFNSLQATYQTDLKNASRWWQGLGLGEQLHFSRDRLVESFTWAMVTMPEPQHGLCREVVAKCLQLLAVIDDIYDVYGTLDELELFTNAVDRWDLKAMEALPDYMKTCFLALYNTTHEIADDILKEQGWNVISYFRKAWADTCEAYLVEAKWFNNKHRPKLEEYLQNAYVSISVHVILLFAYCSFGEKLTSEGVDFVHKRSDIIKLVALLGRLTDDLGTSTAEQERGDVPKSIQCYMHEAGVSKDVACEHIKGLIIEAWKKINECMHKSSPLSQSFMNTTVNFGRTGHFMYNKGDAFGDPDNEDNKRVMSLLIEPLRVQSV